jgi:protein-export membrane protein SecD/preprotein translocase SecF subunit
MPQDNPELKAWRWLPFPILVLLGYAWFLCGKLTLKPWMNYTARGVVIALAVAMLAWLAMLFGGSKKSAVRITLVALICVLCAAFFYPLDKVRLGLDLKGGVHFELEVQGQEALDADLRDTRDRIQGQLSEKGFPNATVVVDGQAVKIDGIPADQKSSVDKVLENYNVNYDNAFDGKSFRITQKSSYQQYLKTDASKRALQIIENRINQFGVSEPEITASGTDGNRIVVELPGVGEAERERIKNLLATPGRLEQRILAKLSDPRQESTNDRQGWKTKEEAMADFGGQLPPNTELLPRLDDSEPSGNGAAAAPQAKQEEKIIGWHVVENKVYVDGADITNASPSMDPTTDRPVVHYTLNNKGTNDFYNLSVIASNENRLIAIALDRKIVSILSCREPIPGGSVQITGRFTKQQTDDFAMKLKSGSMRASMKFLQEQAMGPSLGADSIHSGVLAALIGFAVVVIFMLIFYHWSGLNAIVALTVNLIVMLGLLGSFQAVLTLPGIAGFALTIGMAVDANILIYERIKEEMRNGKSVPGAIQAGFDKVFWTIVDSHVTQLFGALLLFIFGTGPVKGFAVTLTVGVVASLFTSIYISHFIYDWVLDSHPDTKTLSVGTHSFFENAKFDFMRWKGVALAISWGIILACMVIAQPWKGTNGRIRLGMQFVGGIDMQVRFKGQVPQDQVRTALTKGGFGDAAVVFYPGKSDVSDYSIKVRARKGQDEKDSTAQIKQIHDALRSLDAAKTNDTRLDLNTEPALGLTDQWTKANPLNIQGDEETIRKAYEPYVAKITGTREKLGLITSYDQLPQDIPSQLKDLVQKEYRLGNLSILKQDVFSPSISGEWTWKTLQAVLWAMGAILVYVMFRFTMSFAIGGVVALIHDVLMALGLFVLFKFEFSVPVVASFLILIGYSMADTIVVFDRIRENSHKPEYRRAKISQLVNDSINQTLSRTILTSLSVLFVAFCLFQFGGVALRDLAFPIFVGVITGTYSSIYIASPLVVYWERWFPKQDSLKQKHG